MTIFILDASRRGFFGKREKLIPTSCKAIRVKLDRRIPKSWSTQCEGNNLAVLINYQLPQTENNERTELGPNQLKAIIYRELANAMMFIASESPTDNLERTDVVRLKLVKGNDVEINALTFGDKLSKLATLKDPKLIATHLKASVQVQEARFPADAQKTSAPSPQESK